MCVCVVSPNARLTPLQKNINHTGSRFEIAPPNAKGDNARVPYNALRHRLVRDRRHSHTRDHGEWSRRPRTSLITPLKQHVPDSFRVLHSFLTVSFDICARV
jgi:hypothetical protein